MTIVLVTNLVQQARRLADRTAFFLRTARSSRSDRHDVMFSEQPEATSGPTTTCKGSFG